MPASWCRPAIRQVCAARCEREARCRAWTFSYPGTAARRQQCRDVLAEEPGQAAGREPLLRVRRQGRGPGGEAARAGRECRSTASAATTATSISRPIQDGQACKKACEGENRCRAWSFVRPGYRGPNGALLPQGQDHAAEAQAVLHVGRGAVRSARPADRDAVHQQRRLADADRHALAVLAAGADAGVELADRCRPCSRA